MLIHIKGGVSGYEPENIARMFFPGATLTAKYVRGEDLVFAAAGRFRLAAGVRRGGHVRTAPLPQEGESVEFALCSLLYELLGEATGLRMPWASSPACVRCASSMTSGPRAGRSRPFGNCL